MIRSLIVGNYNIINHIIHLNKKLFPNTSIENFFFTSGKSKKLKLQLHV